MHMPAFRVIGATIKCLFDDLWMLVLMNLVTLVLQITLVLGAPSFLALHVMANRVANGYVITWQLYFQALKQYFSKSLKFAAPATIVTLLITFNFLFYGNAMGDNRFSFWVQGAWLALGILWLAIQFYVYPFFVEQTDKHWRVALRNATIIAIANPFFTFVLMGFMAIFLVVSVLLGGLLFALLGLSVWALLGSVAVSDRVRAFRLRNESKQAKILNES
jgi:hypothetical protein